MIVVLFDTTTFVAAALPKLTVAPETKFVPVIVTAVPPPAAPLPGDTLVTVGPGADNADNATIWMTQAPAGLTGAVAL